MSRGLRYSVVVLGVALIDSAVVGAAVAAGASFTDALESVSTAVGVLIALVASGVAVDARDTARKTRRALALHHRPVGSLHVEFDRLPDEQWPMESASAVYHPPINSEVQWSVHFRPPLGSRGVTDVAASWATTDGGVFETRFAEPGQTQVLHGARVVAVRSAMGHPVVDLTSIEVTCRDTQVGEKWVSTSTPDQPDGMTWTMSTPFHLELAEG